jgi:hypothetical protein
MLALTTCWNSSNVQLYVETMQMFILLSLLVNAKRLTNEIQATSTETVPMCWVENRGSLFKSPHIPTLRYSWVKIGDFHGSKKVYGYPHLPQR